MYDLKAIKEQQAQSREVSKDHTKDMAKLLQGYREVSRSEWSKIKAGVHIRYMRKDGSFKKGGYVIAHGTRTVDGKDIRSIGLAFTPRSMFVKFQINLDTIERIWAEKKEIGQPTKTVEERLKEVEAEVARLRIYCDKLLKALNIMDSKITNSVKK
jgi:ribosomal protein S16